MIDCREAHEVASGTIDGSVNIPHNVITSEIANVAPNKATPIKIWCMAGGRAETARKSLLDMGYSDVTNIGGIEDARREFQK